MVKDSINLQRVEQLVRGDQPKGLHEELFVVAFKCGLGGESFMLALLQISDIWEDITHKDKNYFVLGYALGQKTFEESEEVTNMNLANYNNKTSH